MFDNQKNNTKEDESEALRIPSIRLTSLDAFRGAVIACMILVNNPGQGEHVYSQLDHVVWHGWTFADLIAPCFFWIIGVTTVFSLSRRIEIVPNRCCALKYVIKRALLLYALGASLSLFSLILPPFDFSAFESFKVMGILQRIAVSYLVASVIVLHGGPRGVIIWTVVLISGYWAVMSYASGSKEAFEINTNLAQRIDQWLLGSHGDGTHSLLTIIATTSTLLMGAMIGLLLKTKVSPALKALCLLCAGAILICVGLSLDHRVPINRRIWTPSYCIFTSGIASAVFAVFFWLIEVKKQKNCFKLVTALGLNPISLFVLSEVGRILANTKGFVDSTGNWRSIWTIGWEVLVPLAGAKGASLVIGLAYTLAFCSLAWFMQRRGWVFKI